MAFVIERTNELFLLDTKIENIFIHEFMTSAPGDYVKVYLLSLMYAGTGTETTNAEIARQLSLEEEDVLKAWNHWESLGVVRKHFKDAKNKFNYDVEFLCIREQLYGKSAKKGSVKKSSLPKLIDDKGLEELYHAIERIVNRPLSGTELTEIASWLSDYKASPAAITYAYSYCVNNKKKDNHKYVGAVIKEWTSKKLLEVAQIEEHLQEVDQRHFLHKRILKAMGFKRNATEAEAKIMDSWFDEMNFSIERVLEACSKTSGISNPNFNYVNQILVNWHTGKENVQKNSENLRKKSISIANVHKYYDKIKGEAESAASERREQVYLQLPKVKELDEEIRLCGMEMSRIMLSGSATKKQQVASYKRKIEEFSEQKTAMLVENGFAADYMDTKYRCAVCNDSGATDANDRCSCFKQVQSEAEKWQNSKT